MAALLSGDMPASQFQEEGLAGRASGRLPADEHRGVAARRESRCGRRFPVSAMARSRSASRPSKAAAARRPRPSPPRGEPAGRFRSLFDFCDRVDPAAVQPRGDRKPDQSRRVRLPRRSPLAVDRGARSGVASRRRGAGRSALGTKGLFDADGRRAEVASGQRSLPDIAGMGRAAKVGRPKKKCSAFISRAIRWPSKRRTSKRYFRTRHVDAATLPHRTEVVLGGMLASMKFAHTKNPRPARRHAMRCSISRTWTACSAASSGRRNSPSSGRWLRPTRFSSCGAPSIAAGKRRINLIVNELATPADYQSRATRSVEIRLQEDDRAMANLESVYEILRGYPGSCGVQLVLTLTSGTVVELKSETLRIAVEDELCQRLEDLLGTGSFKRILAALRIEAGPQRQRPAIGRGLTPAPSPSTGKGRGEGDGITNGGAAHHPQPKFAQKPDIGWGFFLAFLFPVVLSKGGAFLWCSSLSYQRNCGLQRAAQPQRGCSAAGGPAMQPRWG